LRTSGAFAWNGAGCELIGRERDATRLADLLRTHLVVAVIGPLGIGKSELVRAVVEREAGAGRLPPPANASLAGIDGARGVLERTARALGRRHPRVESSRIVPALCALITSSACTLVWDDAQDAPPDVLGEVLAAVLRIAGAATSLRIVVVARECGGPDGAPGAWARKNGVASLEVPPLEPAACQKLIATFERRRGRSLQEEAILVSSGNPLALQLAVATGPPVRGDPMVGLARAIDALPRRARRVLQVLLAAESSLREADLREVCGSGTARALSLLERDALLAREGDRVSLPSQMSGPVRSLLGAPATATWEALETVARRALAAAPDDPEALLLGCRAMIRRGHAPDALALLGGHVAARAAASPAALERMLGDVARAHSGTAPDALLALAREQLRWGDFEAARRTLDGLAGFAMPAPLAFRRCILRAEALVRAGEPASATLELENARLVTPPGRELALEEGLADLAILRGDLHGARTALFRLGRRTRSISSLEGRRSISLGFSYLLEERHDRAFAWARKARRAYQQRGDAAVDILVPIVEIAALMGLDRIDRATEVAARESAARRSCDDRGLGPGTTILFRAGVLFRRGELQEAMRVGEPAFRALDRRADRIFRARVAHYLSRSAIGLGHLERAEDFIRVAAGIAAEPGLGVLWPMCEMDFALLCEARGERKEAVHRSRRALSGVWQSPLARIDAWALEEGNSPPPKAGFGSARAYGALRSAERALEAGDPAQAAAAAARAEAWYRDAGAACELARSQLALAEALARLERRDEASVAVASCASAADRNGYLPLVLGAHLVRAFLAERAGDVDRCAAELASAWTRATSELRDATLLRACSRAGVRIDGIASRIRPLASRISRLGLDRPARFMVREGDRSWILDAGEEPPARFDLTMDIESGRVRSDRGELMLPPQRLQLLEQLACSGAAGLTLEDLRLRVWGGAEYHPLRHRNAVYVALARLRESLAVLARNLFLEGPDHRYRMAPGLRVAMRRSWTDAASDLPLRAASAK
jgi:tetratricopeptide (TPR) repeat protein